MKEEIRINDDVELKIKKRNGKEVEWKIKKMEKGSVVFEEMYKEIVKGKVLKKMERGKKKSNKSEKLKGSIS